MSNILPDIKYKRKCKNWLETFQQWSLPRSEAPESFHFWAGVYTIASVLKRNVCVPKSLLGGWEIYPTMYIIFVAPPGKARKSTTAGYSEMLLSEVPPVKLAPSSITVEAFFKELQEGDGSVTVFSSEFASFVDKSEGRMYDILTDLFDGKRNYSVGTLSRGLELAERPCVNLLAATTPGWISDNMPESVIGGGFASRVIFVFEDRARRRQLYYQGLDTEALDKLKEDLIKDLIHMLTLEGEFTIADDAKSFMEQWYRDLENTINDNYNARMVGYFERKPAHVHKVAMILHIARSDRLVLELQDFKDAIAVLDKIEVKLPRTFDNIGKNMYASDMQDMIDFITSKGKVSRTEFLGKFISVGNVKMLDDLVVGMAALRKIYVQDEGDDRYYLSWEKVKK